MPNKSVLALMLSCLLLVTYGSAYLLLKDSECQDIEGEGQHSISQRYCFYYGDYSSILTNFFAPANWLDRKLRPDYWYSVDEHTTSRWIEISDFP